MKAVNRQWWHSGSSDGAAKVANFMSNLAPEQYQMVDSDFMRPFFYGEEMRPQLELFKSFKAYYPRKYLEPAGWFSPRIFAYVSHLQLENLHLLDVENNHPTFWEAACSARLAQFKVPTWFVGEQLLESLFGTAPPANFKLKDIKWVSPAMLFCLPIDMSRKLFGRNIPYIAGCCAPLDERIITVPNHLGVQNEFALASKRAGLNSIIIHGASSLPNGRMDGCLSFHLPVTEEATVGDMLTREWPKGFEYERGADQQDDDRIIIDQMGSLFMQFVLLLSMRSDEMQEGGTCISGALTKGKGDTKEIIKPSVFAPRWIGLHYKKPSKPYQGGHHASPILHLRCGHWRDQRVGAGLKGLRPVWIEPTWVNAKDK